MKTELSKKDICVNRAEPDRAKEISTIEKACFNTPWTLEGIKEDIESGVALYFIANSNEAAVGYIGSHVVADECEILRVAVLPEFRKQGVGRLLVAKALEAAGRMDVLNVYLEVRTGNCAARGLYEAAGFEFSGIRRKYYSDPVEDAAIYVKKIK